MKVLQRKRFRKFSEKTEELIICENSRRFTVGALVDIIRNRKLRSMSTKGVVFPFYENIARSWEDTFSVICLAVIIILGAI